MPSEPLLCTAECWQCIDITVSQTYRRFAFHKPKTPGSRNTDFLLCLPALGDHLSTFCFYHFVNHLLSLGPTQCVSSCDQLASLSIKSLRLIHCEDQDKVSFPRRTPRLPYPFSVSEHPGCFHPQTDVTKATRDTARQIFLQDSTWNSSVCIIKKWNCWVVW